MRRKDKKPYSQYKDKITLYIDKDVLKEFKKLAIDQEFGFSAMAQAAFEAYVRHNKSSAKT